MLLECLVVYSSGFLTNYLCGFQRHHTPKKNKVRIEPPLLLPLLREDDAFIFLQPPPSYHVDPCLTKTT